MTIDRQIPGASGTAPDASLRPEWARWSWRWETVVAVTAIVAAAAAFWITVTADFLEYPGWLAVQKADFILGPVFVGLYWRHRRPDNPLGLLMIALGLVFIPYLLESIRSPYPFTIGTMTEAVYIPLAYAIVLAFPNGRLDGRAERLLLVGVVVGYSLPYLLWLLTSPDQLVPRLSLSGCRGICPHNPFAIWSTPTWYAWSVDYLRAALIILDLGAIALLIWKFMTGTPPRRRALIVGAPIAMCYLLAQSIYQTQQLFSAEFGGATSQNLNGPMQWAVAGFRAAPWYGFLFALVAAELFAGRALGTLVRDSRGRPSLRELEGMVRGPLGDPRLRLGFWRSDSQDWVGANGARLGPAGTGQAVTEIDRDGRPRVAIVHDPQLSEDPELLQAAGAVALLALDNAELDAAWQQSLDELADSRARLVRAGDAQRRKLERDLHDGAQQRLVAASIDLALADDLAEDNPTLRERVGAATTEVEEALAELRQIAHGIYPPGLARWGLAQAFESLAARYQGRVTVIEANRERFPSEIEAALYYCCREAVQNAVKHAGQDARTRIRLYTDAGRLHLDVRDDGRGFDATSPRDGIGLQNMRDRLGAVGGRVDITSTGRGTIVAAQAPLGVPSMDRRPHGSDGEEPTPTRPHGSIPSGDPS